MNRPSRFARSTTADKVFFAFKWTDPTRSLRRIPLVKKQDGWHVDTRASQMDVVDFYEDKLAVIFSDKPAIGGAGVSNLGPAPLPADKPRPLNERGFHFTTDGSYVDMWQWKASRGGMLGRVDDQYIGPPRDVSADEAAYRARYQGGYWNDPGRAYYSYNYKGIMKGHQGPVELVRLPKDWKKAQDGLGKFTLDPNVSDDENGSWSININDTDPYSKDADDKIPVGTVMPGVIISGNYEGDRGDLDRRLALARRLLDARSRAQPEDRQQVRQGLRRRQRPLHVGRGVRPRADPPHAATRARCASSPRNSRCASRS